MGRATQGVRLINLRENDAIAAVAKVEVLEGDDEEFEDENGFEVDIVETYEDAEEIDEAPEPEKPDDKKE
jgi:DNA gyrase subunit A